MSDKEKEQLEFREQCYQNFRRTSDLSEQRLRQMASPTRKAVLHVLSAFGSFEAEKKLFLIEEQKRRDHDEKIMKQNLIASGHHEIEALLNGNLEEFSKNLQVVRSEVETSDLTLEEISTLYDVLQHLLANPNNAHYNSHRIQIFLTNAPQLMRNRRILKALQRILQVHPSLRALPFVSHMHSAGAYSHEEEKETVMIETIATLATEYEEGYQSLVTSICQLQNGQREWFDIFAGIIKEGYKIVKKNEGRPETYRHSADRKEKEARKFLQLCEEVAIAAAHLQRHSQLCEKVAITAPRLQQHPQFEAMEAYILIPMAKLDPYQFVDLTTRLLIFGRVDSEELPLFFESSDEEDLNIELKYHGGEFWQRHEEFPTHERPNKAARKVNTAISNRIFNYLQQRKEEEDHGIDV